MTNPGIQATAAGARMPVAGLRLAQLALDVGATKIAVTVTDVTGRQTVARRSTRAVFGTAATPRGAVAQLIRDICRERDIALEYVGSVVIGVPGVLDRRIGTIVSCPNLPELDGVALGPGLSEALGLPVRVENDVNVLALGEATAGRGRGIPDIACVFVGSGIGCGLILGGELYVGADGTAGEFGHTTIEARGRLCTCGNRGCLEMYCSGKALSAWAAEVGLDPPQAPGWPHEFHGAEGVVRGAREGDRAALTALDEAFTYLGLGIANLVNLVNPRLVILGGGVISAWPSAIDRVRDVVRTRARLVARDAVEIDAPAAGNDTFAVGAARLATADYPLYGAA